MGKRRIIVRNREGKVIGLYETIKEASRETNITETGVRRELSGAHYLRNLTFEWEVTNEELRQKEEDKRKKKVEEEWKNWTEEK